MPASPPATPAIARATTGPGGALGRGGLLLALAVALRWGDFGNPVVHVDEQWYLLVGDRMLHGAMPYVDLWDRKPIGLFLLYAGTRLLPGDGILAYQLVATLFAAATALLVERAGRRVGATPAGALAAGAAYLIWLPLLSGRGGQSPVFYNLFMAGGALLTLGLPERTAAGDRRGIVSSGAVACLLAGLAIQIKYTPVAEGIFFGLAHLVYLRRAGARSGLIASAAVSWALLGALPTLAAAAFFALRSPGDFAAFWFADFGSVLLRHGSDGGRIALRLLGTWSQLAPLWFAAVVSLRAGGPATLRIALGWLASALVGYAMIGAFYDHYALPLVAPLAVLAAPTLGRYRVALVAALAAARAVWAVTRAGGAPDARGARAAARLVAGHAGAECPYVFAGDSITYYLANACTPTRYAFPSTLAYAVEQGGTGIDEAAEVRRIMAARPPAVVTLARPLAPWNRRSLAEVVPVLARDYRLALNVPEYGTRLLVFLRRPCRTPGERRCGDGASVSLR